MSKIEFCHFSRRKNSLLSRKRLKIQIKELVKIHWVQPIQGGGGFSEGVDFHSGFSGGSSKSGLSASNAKCGEGEVSARRKMKFLFTRTTHSWSQHDCIGWPHIFICIRSSKKNVAASKNAGNCGRAGQVKWREGKSESCSRAGRCIRSQIVVLPFLKPGKTFEHYRKWEKKLGAERTMR